jgi:hypothetical protein
MGKFGRKDLRFWVAVLLPGLLLRVLMPVGFMPMFGPDFSVQIILCDAYAPVPTAPSSSSMIMSMDMPMDASMDMSVHSPSSDAAKPGGVSPEHQSHNTCLYGSAPSLGALPGPAVLPAVDQRPDELPVRTPQVDTFELLARAQSPRGPPA